MRGWIWLLLLNFVFRPFEISAANNRGNLLDCPYDAAQQSPGSSPKNRPFKEKLARLSLDILFIGGATTGIVMVREDIREAIETSGSFENIADNFRHPISSIEEGTRLDDNSFTINYVVHPLGYAGMGLYLKERGYRDWTALLFTQVHNVAWEFAIEGSAFPPSGKDLLSDLSGSLVGIFLMDRASRYGEKKLYTGDKKFYHYLFYGMNPFNVLNDKLLKKRKLTLVLNAQ